MRKVIFKYRYLIYVDKEVQRVFTPKPMISFGSAKNLSSYLVKVKYYLTKKTVGSCKCGVKHCEVICINGNETLTFTSTFTTDRKDMQNK